MEVAQKHWTTVLWRHTSRSLLTLRPDHGLSLNPPDVSHMSMSPFLQQHFIDMLFYFVAAGNTLAADLTSSIVKGGGREGRERWEKGEEERGGKQRDGMGWDRGVGGRRFEEERGERREGG